MSNIRLVGGERGGVGKSFVCRSVLDDHLERGVGCVPLDADRDEPDAKDDLVESAAEECASELGGDVDEALNL